MRSVAVLVALAAAAVTAQVPNYTSSLNMTLDPNTVPQQQRAVWCQAQTNTCQLLCNANTDKNGCSQADLSYDCTCSSNSSSPALQYYTQTIPTFICQTVFGQCIAQNAGSSQAQGECTTHIQNLCGRSDPPSVKSGSASSTTAAASTAAAATSEASAATSSASSAAQSSTQPGAAGPTLAPGGAGAMAVAAVGLVAYLL